MKRPHNKLEEIQAQMARLQEQAHKEMQRDRPLSEEEALERLIQSNEVLTQVAQDAMAVAKETRGALKEIYQKVYLYTDELWPMIYDANDWKVPHAATHQMLVEVDTALMEMDPTLYRQCLSIRWRRNLDRRQSHPHAYVENFFI